MQNVGGKKMGKQENPKKTPINPNTASGANLRDPWVLDPPKNVLFRPNH